MPTLSLGNAVAAPHWTALHSLTLRWGTLPEPEDFDSALATCVGSLATLLDPSVSALSRAVSMRPPTPSACRLGASQAPRRRACDLRCLLPPLQQVFALVLNIGENRAHQAWLAAERALALGRPVVHHGRDRGIRVSFLGVYSFSCLGACSGPALKTRAPPTCAIPVASTGSCTHESNITRLCIRWTLCCAV